jgi:hypothetical protein
MPESGRSSVSSTDPNASLAQIIKRQQADRKQTTNIDLHQNLDQKPQKKPFDFLSYALIFSILVL